MLLDSFLKGMSLAFYIVIPIGAISVLYMKRTLKKGVASGICSSLGVTTAEGIYAAAAIYGLTFVADFLLTWKIWLQLCGTIFLVWLGAKTFFFPSSQLLSLNSLVSKRQKLFYDYLSMLVLTLTNPLTLIGFIAIFTAFGANGFQKNFANSFAMFLGFIFMSFSYCMILVGITHRFKKKFITDDSDLFKILNQISGLAIILFTLFSFGVALVRN